MERKGKHIEVLLEVYELLRDRKAGTAEFKQIRLNISSIRSKVNVLLHTSEPNTEMSGH